MKVLVVILMLCFCFSCAVEQNMSNDEIIAEVRKCEDAGLLAVMNRTGMGNIHIICMPKEPKP